MKDNATDTQLPHELQENLVSMFKQTNALYVKHAPDRKCSLSYTYLIHKFLQILGRDEYLPSFPLLGSKWKLKKNDEIWIKLCEDLGWEFIPSE